MPFFGFGNAAPTAWSRVQAFALDQPLVTATATATVRGTAASVPGGLYEFDLGAGVPGFIRRASHSADKIVDLSLAGPIINGRDQAGAFANNSWMYLYAMIKASDLATVDFILSANAPTQFGGLGPSGLASLGYQSPLFCGAYRVINPQSWPCGYRRNRIWRYAVSTAANPLVNTATAPTAIQTVNAQTVAPPTALAIEVNSIGSDISTVAAAGSGNFSLDNAAAGTSMNLSPWRTPVLAQFEAVPMVAWTLYDGTNIYYHWNINSGTLSAAHTALSVSAYEESM